MGKPTDQLLKNYVTVRFSNGDYTRLWRVACRDDRSVSSFCRKAVLSELPKREEEMKRKDALVQEKEREIHIVSTAG